MAGLRYDKEMAERFRVRLSVSNSWLIAIASQEVRINRFRPGIVSTSAWVLALAKFGSPIGLELFVTGQKPGPMPVFGKFTIDPGTSPVACSDLWL